MAVKSYAGVETGKTFARAGELWDSLGRPADFLSVPNGLWLFRLARAELQKAQSIADDLLEFGRSRADPGCLILGNHALGVTLLHRGQMLSARIKLEEAVHLYDSSDHSQLFQQAGTDPNVMALAFLGLTLSWLGYPDQAFARIQEAIRRARRSAYVPTMAQCLAMSARLALILADQARLAEWVKELAKLTKDEGYPSWTSQVLAYEGQLRLWRGEAGAAVSLLREGFDAHRASGTTLRSAFYISLLTEALEQDGKSEEALNLLDDQIATVARTDELWCAAELYRRRGELLLKQTVPDLSGAETQYHQAINIARSQSAKLWELRAAMSIARLWRNQSKNEQARDLLTPIYSWFTEGFDTRDLNEAKALLGAHAS
jgi:predicted ATPase